MLQILSPGFCVFLLVVLALFHLSPPRFRWAALLAGSYAFYGSAGWASSLLLLLVSAANYVLARWVAARRGLRADPVFYAAVAVDVLVLALFKYAPALLPAAGGPAAPRAAMLALIRPVGISYYVFQAISYLTDVRRGTTEPERHVGRFLLYLSFFPKVLQGPIERARDLLPQLERDLVPGGDHAARGADLIVGGLLKKALLADSIGTLADAVFGAVTRYHGSALLLGAYAYALQIYLDFSGYTDIARGLASLFGVSLSENFRRPYAATTIQDFWRRWHLSFSFWLRDYLFVPLMVDKFRYLGTAGVILSCAITFAVAGVWHGASWGFLIFGLLHGLYMAVSILTLKRRDAWCRERSLDPRVVGFFRRVATFHLVAVSWVFFRSASVGDACYLLSHLGGRHWLDLPADFSRPALVLMGATMAVLLYQAAVEPSAPAGLRGEDGTPTARRLFDFLYRDERWWVKPVLVPLLGIAAALAVVALLSRGGVAPFAYTRF